MRSLYRLNEYASHHNDVERVLYDTLKTAAHNRGVSDPGLLANRETAKAIRSLRRLKVSPTHIIKAIGTEKISGPLKFYVAFRPGYGWFRDTRFVVTIMFDIKPNGKSKMKVKFDAASQAPRHENDYSLIGDTIAVGMETPRVKLPGPFGSFPSVFLRSGDVDVRDHTKTLQRYGDITKTGTLTRPSSPEYLPTPFRALNRRLEREWRQNPSPYKPADPPRWKPFSDNPDWAYLSRRRGRPSKDTHIELRWVSSGSHSLNNSGKVDRHILGQKVDRSDYEYWLRNVKPHLKNMR